MKKVYWDAVVYINNIWRWMEKFGIRLAKIADKFRSGLSTSSITGAIENLLMNGYRLNVTFQNVADVLNGSIERLCMALSKEYLLIQDITNLVLSEFPKN